MSDKNCIFCKIVNKELPAEIIAETDTVLVIKDIAPKTPIHWLIIPKKHVQDIVHLDSQDKDLAADLLLMAKSLSENKPEAKDFRLITNNGAGARQIVFHLHFHFCSGKKLSF